MDNDAVADELVSFFRSPAIGGIEVMDAQHTSRNWTIYNTNYAVAVPDTWCAEVRLGSRVEVITPATAFCTEPGQLHSTSRVYAPGRFRVLKFEPSAFQCHLQERGFDAAPRWREPAPRLSKRFTATFRSLFLSMSQPCTAMQLQTQAARVIDVAVSELLQGELRSGKSEHVRVKAEMIRECLMYEDSPAMDLDALAERCGLNRFQVLRTFRRHYGVPPHAYQIHVRVARAKALLHAGQSPGEVAVQLGFADQSHMTRLFRRAWGVTPGRYAKGTLELS